MNSNKKNLNGWILCPSKSFPGKFYYFNVANGETAWSLNETEKKSIRNPTIQRIDNPHCYPEPTSPPVDNLPTVNKTVLPNFYRNIDPNDVSYNCPSRSVSNISTFMIQPQAFHPSQNYSGIQVPMLLGSGFQNHAPQMIMILLNPNPGNSQFAIEAPKQIPVQQSEPSRDLFVQQQQVPLSQRFVNYETPQLQFKNNKIVQVPRQYNTSTPNKTELPIFPSNESTIKSPGQNVVFKNYVNNIPNYFNPDTVFRTTETSPEKDPHNPNMFAPSTNTSQTLNQSNISNIISEHNKLFHSKEKNSDRNLQRSLSETNPFKQKTTLTQSFKSHIPSSPVYTNRISSPEHKDLSHVNIMKENPTLNQGNKLDITASNNPNILEELEDNDLRRMLMERKRKAVNLDVPEPTKGQKIKTYRQENMAPPPKKKVTFNLEPENFSDITSAEDFSYNGNSKTAHEGITAIQELRMLASPSMTSYIWYIVVDTATLLEELQFLDEFVQTDPKCNLFIPSRVMEETAAISRGECRERHLVTLARHSLRRLATPQLHIVVQPSQMDRQNYVSTPDSILNCCLELMKQNAHVVLLTNDDNLRAQAEYLQIHCFSLDQIKNSSVKKPEVHFDIKKIKISITNVPEHSESATKTYENTFDSAYNDRNTNIQGYSGLDLKTSQAVWQNTANVNMNNISNLKTHNIANSQPTAQITRQISNVPNSNETVSFYFQNRGSNLEKQPEISKNPEKESQTVSFYFQNEKNAAEQRSSSVFKPASDKVNKNAYQNNSTFEIKNQHVSKQNQSNSSIFEIDGIEKIESCQKKPPIFGSNFQNGAQNSIFERKNRTLQLKRSIFDSPNKETEMKPASENKTEPKPSIFENGDKNKNVQIKKSVYESNHPSKDIAIKSVLNNKMQTNKTEPKPISVNEKRKNSEVPKPIFENEKHKNRGDRSKLCVFEKNGNNEPVLPYEINCENLEEYTEYFLDTIADGSRIEQTKEEIICNFTQVMEECLTDVLNQSKSEHKVTYPWLLNEMFQCITKIYSDHETILNAVNILYTSMKGGYDVITSDLVKFVACGVILVRYMKSLASNPDPLIDAEDSLNTILRNIANPKTSLDIQLLKTPVISRSDTLCEEYQERKNFVKDHSEMVKYMKKHFPAWNNYDETLEDTTSKPCWGQNYENVKVVRTCGKNLNLLKLSKTKSMTMNLPNGNKSDVIDNNSKEKEVIIKHNAKTDDINNKKDKTSEKVDAKNVSPKNAKDKELKFTINVENKPNNLQNCNKQNKNEKYEKININFANDTKVDADTQKSDFNPSEPKVIRLFNSISVTKEKDVDSEKPVCNTDYTHGHTFGTDDKTGPKVVRNVQFIKEFEEKLKNKRPTLDLDKLDYSVMSESDDDVDDEKNDDSDHYDDYVSANDEGKFNNSADKSNDKLDATNDKLTTKDDTEQIDSFINGSDCQATINEIHSMSFDNFVRNDIDAANDLKNYTDKDEVEICAIKTENGVKYDINDDNNGDYVINDISTKNNNHFGSDYISCLTNIVSCGTNEELYEIDCKEPKYTVNDSDAIDDGCAKMMQKDDTNDSGYENESLQAYSILKSFLSEVNGSFKLVHKFIEGSIEEFRHGKLLDRKRQALHSKSYATHVQIMKIIEKLKCINQRELSETTSVKTLIAGAGVLATDKHISRYGHVVTQCLKQGQMLAQALKLMISVTDGSINRDFRKT